MGGRTEKKVETVEDKYVSVQDLSYEDSLRVTVGEISTGGLTPVPEQSISQETINRNLVQGGGLVADFINDGFVGPIAGIASLFGGGDIGTAAFHATFGLFGRTGWNEKRDVEDSGYQLADNWAATRWDRARYSIGIKELGIFSNQYAQTSEIVSVEYRTPGPIRKAVLHADYTIPREFLDADPLRSWIEFFVSFDDGGIWLPIAPVSNVPATDNTGNRIPVLVNVNSPLPESERSPLQAYFDTDRDVKRARVRVRLNRPEGTDFERSTVVLRAYRMKFVIGRSLV